MKQANTNTSLRTYTCTYYFPEYNKCKSNMILQMNKTNKHHNTQS